MTPHPVPATLIDELIARVNQIGQQCPHDMLELRRCEMEAKRLFELPEFSADAAAIRGMLAAIQDDLGELIRWHELAIQISGGDPISYDHYATSLLYIYEYERAFKAAKTAFEKSGQRKSLDAMIMSCLAIGDEDLASEYIFEWQRRYGEECPGLHIVHQSDFNGILDQCAEDIASKKNLLSEADFDMEGMRALAKEISGSM